MNLFKRLGLALWLALVALVITGSNALAVDMLDFSAIGTDAKAQAGTAGTAALVIFGALTILGIVIKAFRKVAK